MSNQGIHPDPKIVKHLEVEPNKDVTRIKSFLSMDINFLKIDSTLFCFGGAINSLESW